MFKQREATVSISASVPMSVFAEVEELKDILKNRRSSVIRDLIMLGLKTYSEQQKSKSKKGDDK
jgi:metal-responsive CopG/Arc/MetJ family transcriptional regulator